MKCMPVASSACQSTCTNQMRQNSKLTDHGLLPPLNALAGLGAAAAANIVQAREKGVFLSVDDLKIPFRGQQISH